MSKKLHFLTYPFPLLGRRGGGLLSAFAREAQESDGSVVFLSADTEPGMLGRVPIQPAMMDDALSADDMRALRKRWFSVGLFQLLHPDAYTDAGTPRNALEAMYQADGISDGEFDLQRLLDFLDRHAPAIAVERRFNACFDGLLRRIPPGSAIHWQDLFFAESIHRHAQSLRERGCLQTMHIHEPLPPSLHRSAWGRSLLSALSRLDRVFVHTDAYLSSLEQQLCVLDLPVPDLARFDLGVDEVGLLRDLATVEACEDWRQSPQLRTLQPRQYRCVEEVFCSRSAVPHRFIATDRLDAIKGSGVVIDAIDEFLGRRLGRGEDLGQLRKRYRFFMIHDLWDEPESSLEDMQWQYIRHVRGKYARLECKYPGVVWAMPSLEGDQKVLLPSMMRGAHGMTGGIQDGLNLAIMENLVINEDEDTSVVAGTGAGFVLKSIAEGLGDGACFVERGSVQSFAEGLERLVELRDVSPGRMREGKRALVARIRRSRAHLATS